MPGKEGADYLEGRIFSCGADQGNYSFLHGSEQRILLRLVEAVYFINEKNRSAFGENALDISRAPVNYLAYILHPDVTAERV